MKCPLWSDQVDQLCFIQSLELCGSIEAANSSSRDPETPDSSVKEEPAAECAPTPPTASWTCLWADCGAQEFPSQRGLVDHVNESHMEIKKGFDELPCLWKVRGATCN